MRRNLTYYAYYRSILAKLPSPSRTAPRDPKRQLLIRNKLPKGLYGPFGAKALIRVSILMDTEALAGFAMPARAPTFRSIDCTNSLGGSAGPPRGPPDAENLRFSQLIKRIHTNERRSPGGLRPKKALRVFWKLVPNK